MLDNRFLSEASEFALAVAAEAGQLLLKGYRNRTEARKKSRFDLVTEYDLRSEELIRARLHSRFPDHLVIGEETTRADERLRPTLREELVWYVDPIDGTTNFAHGHPFFSVSLALCAGPKVIVGVVLAPVLDLVWWAAEGGGAWRKGVSCRVSSCVTLEDALCSTGFPYSRTETSDNNHREFTAMMMRCQGVRRCGSAAIDLAMVADGTYDVYWEQSLQPWDVAAGALLVTEAGGRVSGYAATPFDLSSGRIIATNGHLHNEATDVIQSVRGA